MAGTRLGAMQDWTMRVTAVIDHAAREAPEREIVSRWADGSETRTNWSGIRRDALKMAQALQRLGLKPGDKVASLAMNHPATWSAGMASPGWAACSTP